MRPEPGNDPANRLRITAADTGRIIREIDTSDGGQALLWSPDSRWLMAAGTKTNQVLDARSGTPMFACGAAINQVAGQFAFSSDSKRHRTLPSARRTRFAFATRQHSRCGA